MYTIMHLFAFWVKGILIELTVNKNVKQTNANLMEWFAILYDRIAFMIFQRIFKRVYNYSNFDKFKIYNLRIN